MIFFSPIPKKYSPFSLWYLLATWFHSGRLNPAPGTWGSLAALPFIYLAYTVAGNAGIAFMAAILFILGYCATKDYIEKTGEKDASPVVIDEVVGMSITLIPVAYFDPILWALGFILFRLFDAVKIGPVGWCDRKIPGAYGVMADDIVAGLLAAFAVVGYQLYVG